jgi:hypothetical protein
MTWYKISVRPFIREITGNFLRLAALVGNKGEDNPAISGSSWKISCKVIRELFCSNRELMRHEQGNPDPVCVFPPGCVGAKFRSLNTGNAHGIV